MPCAGRGSFERWLWARRVETIRCVPRLRGSGRPAAPHRRGRKSALKTKLVLACDLIVTVLSVHDVTFAVRRHANPSHRRARPIATGCSREGVLELLGFEPVVVASMIISVTSLVRSK